MSRKTDRSLASMQKKMLGCIGSMSYYYAKFCVKADPTALLEIEIQDEDLTYHVEDLAVVIPHTEENDDDKIDLIPQDADWQLTMLSQAVSEYYPEFKQEIMTAEKDEEEERSRREELEEQGLEVEESEDELHYLRLTMPVVDDDRKKVIDDGIKAIYDSTKARMDTIFSFHAAEIATLTVGASETEVKEVKKNMEEIKSQYEDMREQLTDDKRKEVEAANKRYHEQKEENGGEAHPLSSVGQSVKLS